MVERRSLVEGIAGPAAQDEQQFVYGDQSSRKPEQPPPPREPTRGLPRFTSRVPITTRARPELAAALKRASLERQLSGAAPYYVQDILEEALTAWLRSHGHLDD